MGQINSAQNDTESKNLRKNLYMKSDSSESNKHFINIYFY
jgi:hypothetical protein